METPTLTDDIKRFWGLLRRWAYLVIGLTLAIGAMIYVVNKQTTPVYQAVTMVLINEAPSTRNTDHTSLMTSERLAQTYSQLMAKQPVLQSVIQSVGLPFSVEEL